VGSFNLNLRSTFLNSETALIVVSPELAERVAASIEDNLRDENSWRVTLNEHDNVRWQTTRDGRMETSTHEPDTGFWRRFASGFYSLWPIEKYL
jgi:cardiolipin synthase C